VRSQRGNEEVVWSKSIKFNHKESGTELSSVMTFATDIAKYTQYCDKSAQAKSGRCAALDVAAFDFEQSDKCGNCAPGNDCFTTVNAVINSAITKLAKVTPLAPDRTLYRGVAGMGFSPELLELEHGPRGFVEFAFSSATKTLLASTQLLAIASSGRKGRRRQQRKPGGWTRCRACRLS
jgi:hypothetical protein